MDVLPFSSLEGLVDPIFFLVVEISIPTYANPIQFETLDIKLTRYIFKVEGRSHVCIGI